MNEDFLKDIPAEDLEVTGPPAATEEKSVLPQRAIRTLPVGISTRDVVRLIFKHKWNLLIPFVLVSAAGIAYTLQATPWYVATARIQITPNPLQDILPGEGVAYGRNVLADQVQLLLSDTMLQKVVEDLYLDDRMPALFESDLQKGDRVSVVINILRERILNVHVLADTNFVVIEARWPEKDLAAVIPNTLAELYVESTRKRLADTASRFYSEYTKQAELTQQQIDEIEDRIAGFLRRHKIVSIESKLESLSQEISSHKQRAIQEENNIITLEEEIRALEEELSLAASHVSASTALADNPEYLAIQDSIHQLKAKRLSFLGIFKPDSKVMRQIDFQIKRLEEELNKLPQRLAEEATENVNPRIEEIQMDLAKLRPLRRASRARLKNLNAKLETLEKEYAEVEQLNRDYRELVSEKRILERKLAYQRTLAIKSEEKKGFAEEISDVLIADKARRPVNPAYPNTTQNILLSLLAGLGIGIGLSVFREITNRTVETSDDVQKYLGLPVLGTIQDKAFR